MAPPPNRQSSVYLAWRLASCGLVVGRASYGGIVLRCPTGRRSGGGASIGHRLEREYEAGYTGAQESRRCYTAKAPNAAGTLGALEAHSNAGRYQDRANRRDRLALSAR